MNKNKYLRLKPVSGTYQNEVENIEKGDGLVVRILKETWQNVLAHIESIVRFFKGGIILYEKGELLVFTNMSAVLADKVKASIGKSDFKLKLDSIGHWLAMYDSFFICNLNDREQLVLPKVQRTKHLFEQLKEKRPMTQVCVKFADLFLDGFASESHRLSKPLRNDTLIDSYKHTFWKVPKNSSKRTVSLKRSRIVNIHVYTPRDSWVACPLSGEIPNNENFPQQVSEEQSDIERSAFAFSNGPSLPYRTDQASSLAVGGESFHRYHEHNAATRSGNAHANNISQYARNPSNTGQQPRHPDYIDYNDRRRSYARWTHRSPDPSTLSKAGFFFTNEGDLVRCYQCGIGLKDFSDGDDPLKEHVRHSGSCLFLIQFLGESRLAEWKRLLQAEDPELYRQMQWNERHNISEVAYRHPEYQTLEARLATFTSWPAHMMQRPEQLADAGLYYSGVEDLVRCFACDGGLRRWDPDDDPWTEHCRWFPACPYAKEKKGDEYIALVQAAVAFENEENESAQSRGQDLSGAMEQMSLRDPEFRAALNEHKDACLEMGYQLPDFNEAVQELRNRGTIKPTIEEIIDVIEVIKARKMQESAIQARQNETPVEENQRLKSYIICMSCHLNKVNALFLPCTHHRMCLDCAERVTNCPVCDRYIRQKIRTYLV